MSQGLRPQAKALVPAVGTPTPGRTRNYEARGPGWLLSMGATVSGNLSGGHLEKRRRCRPHLHRKVEMGPSTWQQ